MKQLKLFSIGGFFFIVILGTLAHFIYGWTNANFIAGLFTPINETTWEHMKLLFFPGLLWSYIMHWKLKAEFPQLLCNLFIGTIAGTWFIPILFYLYTGILGFHTLSLDIAVFVVSAAISCYVSYRQAATLDHHRYYCQAAFVCTAIMLFSFWTQTIVQLG